MYISTDTLLNTALSGVEAAEEELETTSENISNDDTTDYEEETVDLSESESLNVTDNGDTYQIGEGVDVTGVTNSSDVYLDAEWRSQNATTNAAETAYSYLEQIDSAVGDTSDDDSGVSTALSTFWTDWSDLADDPTSSAAQESVINAGEGVADALNELYDDIAGSDSSSVLSQADSQYNALLEDPSTSDGTGGEVYEYASEIAQLNAEIVDATAGGESANTLIDQRNEYIDDLSALGNVIVDQNSDGSVTVYFGGVTSTALVAGSDASDPTDWATSEADNEADDDTDSPVGNNFESWESAYETEVSDASSASDLAETVGGTLGSLLGLAGVSGDTIATASTLSDSDTLTGTISEVITSLNTVASSLATEVNDVYTTTAGYSSSYDFFAPDGSTTDTDEITAANIAVNSQYTSGSLTLPAGSSTGGDGDNTVATDEAELSGGTADQNYDSFVELVGDLTSSAEETQNTEEDQSTQLTDQRDSVESVDLDQEMENLIAEQQAYEASAKVMNAFSTIMDALMEVVGQ